MGKTNPTYRDLVSKEEQDWQRYRRMLRREHKPAWDELWTMARNHADAGHQQNPVNPKWGIMYSMMLGQQLRIQELEECLEALPESDTNPHQ